MSETTQKLLDVLKETKKPYLKHIKTLQPITKFAGEDYLGYLTPDTCPCGEPLPLRTLRSCEGWYIGRTCPRCGPYSRESPYFDLQEYTENCIPDYLEQHKRILVGLGLLDKPFIEGYVRP